MIDDDIYTKIKLMIEKKLKSDEKFTFDEIYNLLLDENDGEISNNINDKDKLNKINEVIRVLIGENIDTIYKQIYR
jgi:hypothetical protein